MPKPAILLTLPTILIFGAIMFRLSVPAKSQVLAAQTSQETQIEELEQQAVYWQNLVNSSPSYRDGFIQLAVIYYRLNEDEVAKYWLNKAFDSDPNYELPPTLSFLVPLLLPQ